MCSLVEVIQMFSETDPQILLDMYNQVGKSKEILIETMLNGGQLPPEYMEQATGRNRRRRRRQEESKNNEVQDLN
jgi:hypothetical protein